MEALQQLTGYLVSLADLNELVLCSGVFVFVRMPETQMAAGEKRIFYPWSVYNLIHSSHHQKPRESCLVRTIS